MIVNKTYLELATEAATAMVNRGQLKIPQLKGEDWKDYNKKAIKTFGWAVLELYREIQDVTRKAKEQPKDGKPMKLIQGSG